MIATNQKVLIWFAVVILLMDDTVVTDEDDEDRSLFWTILRLNPEDGWLFIRLPDWTLLVDAVDGDDAGDEEEDVDVDADTREVLIMIKMMGHIKL